MQLAAGRQRQALTLPRGQPGRPRTGRGRRSRHDGLLSVGQRRPTPRRRPGTRPPRAAAAPRCSGFARRRERRVAMPAGHGGQQRGLLAQGLGGGAAVRSPGGLPCKPPCDAWASWPGHWTRTRRPASRAGSKAAAGLPGTIHALVRHSHRSTSASMPPAPGGRSAAPARIARPFPSRSVPPRGAAAMATLKLKKPAVRAANRPPVRGGTKRPTLSQAQTERERAARGPDTGPERGANEGPARPRPRPGDRPDHGGPGAPDRPRPSGPRRDARTDDRRGPSRPGGDDRPRGDRPRGDRPNSDRPYNDRPRADRPQGDRPTGDRPPGDRPFGDRPRPDHRAAPRGDRPGPRRDDDRPQRPRPEHGQRADTRPNQPRPPGPRPARPAQDQGNPWDRPRDERPASDRPRDDRPRHADKRPDRPWEQRPGPGRASDARGRDERPARPTAERTERGPSQRPRPDTRGPRAERQGPDAGDGTPRRGELATGERLSKRLGELGMASRREADDWIAAGWVRVDGRMAVLGQRVGPNVKIEIDPAARNQQAQRMTILLHKPIGYVSGQPEDGHEPAVVLVKAENRWAEDPSALKAHPGHLRGLAPAGRLDIDSTGLLVLTQDGRVAKALIGEHSLVEKEYLVRVAVKDRPPEDGHAQDLLDPAAITLLQHGLELDGEALKPAKVSWQNEDQLRIVLREGKKRQIRRMCEAVGLDVLGLKRVRIGRIPLGALPVGQWRYLAPWERFD
ncbi:MAG: pseudouridine synthase [Burkholderiales bacterium]